MSLQQETDAEIEEAAMEAAFARAQPAEKPAAELPAPVTEPEQPSESTATEQPSAASTEPAKEEDEFAGLPPKVRAMLAKMEALEQAASLVPVLERRVRQAEGRLGDLNSRIPVPPPPAPKRLEKVEAVRQDLPEVIDALEEMLADRMPPKAVEAPQRQEPAETPTPVLDQERPTWLQDLGSADFRLWLSQQDPAYRERVTSTDQEAVILAALGRFDTQLAAHRARQEAERAAAAKLTQTRQTRTAAAAVPQGAARRPLAAMSEEDAMEAAFAARRGRN
jgi:hypothetical protein